MSRAPLYDRSHSFSDHASLKPSVPLPGQWVDEELDGIALSLGGLIGDLDGVLGSDGGLLPGVVGLVNLEAGLVDELAEGVRGEVEGVLIQVQSWAGLAQVSANKAEAARISAEGVAAGVSGEASRALDARIGAERARDEVVLFYREAANAAVEAGNERNAAEGFANEGMLYRDRAFEWAEKLDGPVEEAEPGWPNAVEGGMFSSKWWAIRAKEWGEGLSSWYIGSYDADPVYNPANGEDLVEGLVYWNTPAGEMRVFDGTGWVSIQLGSGVIGPPGPPGPEGFGVVVPTLSDLGALLGPLDRDVALVISDDGGQFQFKGLDSTPADGVDVFAPVDGTPGRWHRLIEGRVKVSDGSWDGGHVVLGVHHVWIDGDGRLRVKAGEPVSDDDGKAAGGEYYEQALEPVGAAAGAIWVDTSV